MAEIEIEPEAGVASIFYLCMECADEVAAEIEGFLYAIYEGEGEDEAQCESEIYEEAE